MEIKKRIMATVSLHHCCNDASVIILPSIFPILFTQSNLIEKYSDIGTMTFIGLFVAVALQHLIGHNAKTRHSRYYLALDALIVGISLFFLTFAKNFTMLIILFLGVRIGTSIYHPVGISWISHTFRGKPLDKAIGFQSAFGNVGALLTFTTTGFIAQHFGWKVPLYIWATINLAAAAAGLVLSRNTTDHALIEESKKNVSWNETLKYVYKFIPLMLLSGACWGISVNYGSSLLNHGLGISMTRTGMILGLMMGAGTISTFFYGKMSEKFQRTKMLCFAYTVMSISSLTIGLSRNAVFTTIMFAIYGGFLFITYPMNLSFVGNSISGRNRMAAFSLVSNIMIVGNCLFSFLAGFLSDSFGIHTPFLFLSVFSFVLLIYIIIMKTSGKIVS